MTRSPAPSPIGSRSPAEVPLAARAVQIDDSLAEAHCALGVTALMGDFDVPAARRELRRAMELNPKYPQATAWFALFVLAYIDGQFDEAVALMAPIVELERWSPIFGQVVKVESRSDRRNLECHERDGATRLS